LLVQVVVRTLCVCVYFVYCIKTSVAFKWFRPSSSVPVIVTTRIYLYDKYYISCRNNEVFPRSKPLPNNEVNRRRRFFLYSVHVNRYNVTFFPLPPPTPYCRAFTSIIYERTGFSPFVLSPPWHLFLFARTQIKRE